MSAGDVDLDDGLPCRAIGCTAPKARHLVTYAVTGPTENRAMARSTRRRYR